MDKHLAAVCGLYCGACTLYRARRDENTKRLKEVLQQASERWQVPESEIECDGCLAGGRLTPYCKECGMRLCAENRPGVTRCSDCPDFPCKMNIDFNNDGLRHHAEVLANLRHLREIGPEQWLVEQEERWRCPECGIQIDWYARACYACGTTQPYRLPRLPRDKTY